MPDATSGPVPRPSTGRGRWTSFVAAPARGREVRGPHEVGNPRHRVRVEHDRHTLLLHVSDEDGGGWTTLAIDRTSRQWSLAQRDRQVEATEAAYRLLYG